ncbi:MULTISPECIES: cytochrome c [unclassified Azospirillum]|uniref:c-type cytochrome n=1 Tax=unclassified Azospirillum TaxID=2630922 RepID=UPI000B6AB143|nr:MULTISPECIES: cytochrome c [unclassified Azospirillum]SNS13383.1 nitric oxide reductase, NorC subunit apoprotein [Azospirillum sp. RU38E]SNS30493.1 nitric oxide reductase, NorC subunit apoprotein [Azospirillum sp. RU37A]
MSSTHEPHRPPVERFSKSAARNIFYGGSVFFFAIFIGLTAQSHWHILTKSTDEATMSAGVLRGKHVWEKNSCINCHSILGEGAYFAPELGNVWVRFGGRTDPQSAREGLIAWMQSQPSGIEGRRQMPQFHLSDQELNDLVDFLEWTSRIKTQGWPPNDAG